MNKDSKLFMNFHFVFHYFIGIYSSIRTELRAYENKVLFVVVGQNLSLFNIFRDLCFEYFSHKLLAFGL